MYISIHAPTRGATKAQKYLKRYYIISIHAPTRGATNAVYFFHTLQIFQSTLPREERHITGVSFMFQMYYFNPRSHERSDMLFHCKYFHMLDFNPRSHERSDQDNAKNFKSTVEFQSTLPREERRQSMPLYRGR